MEKDMNKATGQRIKKEVVTKSLKDFSSEEALLLTVVKGLEPIAPSELEDLFDYLEEWPRTSTRDLVQGLLDKDILLIESNLGGDLFRVVLGVELAW